MSEFHITPINDLKEHEENTTCQCAPSVRFENGEMIVVHNAFDMREFREDPKRIFGYFDSPQQQKASFDPGIDNVPCIFCWKELSHPVCTVSLMKAGDNKSYFYRAHKSCYDGATPDEINQYESSLIDNI